MKKIYLLLSCLIILFAGCTLTHEYGPYYGKVIDTETKDPIEGAAVLVVFYTVELGLAGDLMHYINALETITDKNGEFRISAHRITAIKFLNNWDRHGYFNIFKPGYGCYPRHKNVKPMFVPNGSLPERQYVTVELPKITNELAKERLRNAACLPSPNVPDEKYRKLRSLIEDEYKRIDY